MWEGDVEEIAQKSPPKGPHVMMLSHQTLDVLDDLNAACGAVSRAQFLNLVFDLRVLRTLPSVCVFALA